MCTVSYLPLGNNNFILTSNRDESPLRKTLVPAIYKEKGMELVYPKDEEAGGTWIGLSDKQRLVCLLNGGFEKHVRSSSYRMSRGVIVKEILTSTDPVGFINNFDFENIEPFTIVLVDWANQVRTYELVWDGEEKHFSELLQEPKIWSSSTLYDSKTKQDRKDWFQDWLGKNPKYSKEGILAFHHNKDLGSKTNSPIMDRLFVKTVSISCVTKDSNTIEFSYEELASGKVTELTF